LVIDAGWTAGAAGTFSTSSAAQMATDRHIGIMIKNRFIAISPPP